MNVPESYFTEMYADSDDPWGFRTRWYEQRKRALTLAALPRPTYRHALEVGASVGLLAAGLAARCVGVTAVEGDPRAASVARREVPANVRVVEGWVPGDWPSGRYDLVVLSEVGYYFDASTWNAVLDLAERDLQPDGVVVACHWRHPVADYAQTGDNVHEALADRWPRVSRVEEEDFLLEVFSPSGQISVARAEGLVE